MLTLLSGLHSTALLCLVATSGSGFYLGKGSVWFQHMVINGELLIGNQIDWYNIQNQYPWHPKYLPTELHLLVSCFRLIYCFRLV